jgi:hypothetical protein
MTRRQKWFHGAALVLPLTWVTCAGCGGGSEPPAGAGKPGQVKVDLGKAESAPAGKAEGAPKKEGEATTKDGGAAAEGWGDLTGTIVFVGDVPEPRVLVREGDPNAKDPEVCAMHTVVSEELVVNKDNKGIKNVFVYLRRAPRVAPELAAVPAEPVVLDQKGCTFLPHALIARVGQPVLIKSDDNIRHNTHTNFLKNQNFNNMLAPADRVGMPFNPTAPENRPMPIVCDIHTWMRSSMLVLDHPYAAITDENGAFKIEKLPAGELEINFWQEKAGDLEKRTVTITDGQPTDLGTIEVPAAKFQQ